MKIKYYCGLSLDLNQEKECESQGVIELDKYDSEEYYEGCFSMICPLCNREIYQSEDHFELVEEGNNKNVITIGNIANEINYLIFKLNCAFEDENWSLVIDVRVELEKLLDKIKGVK